MNEIDPSFLLTFLWASLIFKGLTASLIDQSDRFALSVVMGGTGTALLSLLYATRVYTFEPAVRGTFFRAISQSINIII